MEHNDIRHKLSEYIDNALPADERDAVEAHLKSCRTCNDALDELRKTVEQVRQVEEVEPPDWMTRKIMAKVRAEAKKRSLFQRLFYPLAIKLPIQAVAVVFLSITAFYIYKNIQPAQAPSEAPIHEFAARQEARQKGARAKEHTITQEPPDRLRKVPQSPGYKALDMKLEYEKPAPPRAKDKAEALAPAKADEQPSIAKQETVAGKAAAPQAGAPAIMRDQAVSVGAAAPTEAKLKSSRQALNAVSADKAGPKIVLRVKDVEAATREVEQTIARLGGSIVKKENIDGKKVFVAKINAQKLPDLKSKLKVIGNVTDETATVRSQDGRVELRIELMPDSTQP